MHAHRLLLLAFAAITPLGCVERTMTVTSSPPGALVYLNDQEIGRTPVTRDFLWYGNYDVALRKDGYEAIKTTQNVKAPIYQIVPIDLFAEVLPFHLKDDQHFSYTLTPLGPPNPAEMVHRAQELKKDLKPSERPPAPPAAP